MSKESPVGLLSTEDYFPRAFVRERRENYTHLITVFLMVGDVLMVTCSLIIGYWLRFESFLQDFGVPSGYTPSLTGYFSHFLLALGAMMALLVFSGHYSRDTLLRPLYSALMALQPIFVWGAIFTSLSLMLKIEPEISRLFVLYTLVSMLVLLPAWRELSTRFVIAPYFSKYLRHKTLVIGWCERVEELVERSEQNDPIFPLSIAGVVSTREGADFTRLPSHIEVLGLSDGYSEVICSNDYDTVLLADSELDYDSKVQIQQICAREMMDFMVLPNHITILPRCLSVRMVQGIPLLTQRKSQSHRLDAILLKRTVDIVGATVGLILFAPVIAFFCWRVKRESSGPAFYRQVRLTRGGKAFEIIKIRSMRMDAEMGSGAQWCKEDDPRRLKVGAFMRRTNIDELPQFWNVLKGDMSLVGPRPERPELIKNFKSRIDYYNMRHTVKCGLTGWAQVNGWRGDTDLSERIICDIEYIERAGFWFDLYIILRTIRAYKNAH